VPRRGLEQRSLIFHQKNRRAGGQTKLFDEKVLVEAKKRTRGPLLLFLTKIL